ncbi:MAG TPA: permease prefix domain 1-containing protein, partial [Gemmatimonadales bacterium]|nr:permease prefix domain 1-containing protein [Gemmatimonadales bacterium]
MAFSGLTRLFRLVVRLPAVEQDIDAEIAFHLEEETRALMAAGLAPDAARLEARRRFGNLRESRAAMARLDRERRMRTKRANRLEDLAQ